MQFLRSFVSNYWLCWTQLRSWPSQAKLVYIKTKFEQNVIQSYFLPTLKLSHCSKIFQSVDDVELFFLQWDSQIKTLVAPQISVEYFLVPLVDITIRPKGAGLLKTLSLRVWDTETLRDLFLCDITLPLIFCLLSLIFLNIHNMIFLKNVKVVWEGISLLWLLWVLIWVYCHIWLLEFRGAPRPFFTQNLNIGHVTEQQTFTNNIHIFW